MKNGLDKTVEGQRNTSHETTRTKDKSQTSTLIKNCTILKVKGVATWEDFTYDSQDGGGILVDIALPTGRSLVDNTGNNTQYIENVRLRPESYQSLMCAGLFPEDFIGGNIDLNTPFFSYSEIQNKGEAVLKTVSKDFSRKNTNNNDIITLAGDKIVPNFSFLLGAAKDNASKILKEMFLYEKAMGEYK
jgi:hypothetical protein